MERLPQNSCACGSKENLVLCVDCYMTGICCRACCLQNHQNLPFHRIKHWNGNFFTSSSLYAEGHIFYLGHGGKPCPHNTGSMLPSEDTFVNSLNLLAEEDLRREQQVLEAEEDDFNKDDSWVDEKVPETIVVMVHTTGVFQHHV